MKKQIYFSSATSLLKHRYNAVLMLFKRRLNSNRCFKKNIGRFQKFLVMFFSKHCVFDSAINSTQSFSFIFLV